MLFIRIFLIKNSFKKTDFELVTLFLIFSKLFLFLTFQICSFYLYWNLFISLSLFGDFLVSCANNCSSNGICKLGKCLCFRGFKGPSCNQPDTVNVKQLCLNDCSGHGTYELKWDRCNCDWHFTGDQCETGNPSEIPMHQKRL